jgi:hypothetical protein
MPKALAIPYDIPRVEEEAARFMPKIGEGLRRANDIAMRVWPIRESTLG